MKRVLAGVVVGLLCLPSAALAQERVGDAALGALSGAVVLGPVGAVAGAVVGYTAGPSIAQSWGLRRSAPPRQGNVVKRGDRVSSGPAVSTHPRSPPAAVQPATPANGAGARAEVANLPPVPPAQGYE